MSAAVLNGMAAVAGLLSIAGMWFDWHNRDWFAFWCGLGTLAGLVLLFAP